MVLQIMQKFKLLVLILLIFLTVSLQAQEQEPTPFSPILIQGNPNVGQLQPFVMSDVAIRSGITSWQLAGWTGQGVRVGVLDRGFGGLSSFEENFDTNVQVYIGHMRENYNANPVFHGVQVLETIHAIAPEAELFVCEYSNVDSFTLCIDWLIASNINIINHSAGVPALPLNGTSRWARQVERATNQGILWVNAAGNFASGYYRGTLTDSNINQLHEFRGNSGVVEALGVEAIGDNVNGVAMLSWRDYNGISANAIDIDLQILDASTGEPIAVSQQIQNGSSASEALEYIQFDMSNDFAIQIIDVNGNAAGVQFALFVEFATLPGGEIQRSIITPADSSSSLTVGALQGVNVADYSSRGPIETGAIKPDLTAPGEVQLADGSLFVGTSAAAPIVAGSAALIWQSRPEFTQREVRTFILNALQDDDETFGADVNYGNGRLYLPLPDSSPEEVALVDTPISTTTDSPTNIPLPQATITTAPTNTPLPEATNTTVPVSSDGTVTVNVSSANLRTGPGTEYNTSGSASSGTVLDIIARTSDSEWYLIEKPDGNPAWIWSGIVDVNGSNARIEIVATIPATPNVDTSNSSTNSGNCPFTAGASWFQEGPNNESGVHIWGNYSGTADSFNSQLYAGAIYIKGGFVPYQANSPSTPTTINYWTIDDVVAGLSDDITYSVRFFIGNWIVSEQRYDIICDTYYPLGVRP
ncbi:MAG: hypothetical protein Phog2KO_50690 [Phototrophicaceae bacterium]